MRAHAVRRNGNPLRGIAARGRFIRVPQHHPRGSHEFLLRVSGIA
jgi:hypothetical protein